MDFFFLFYYLGVRISTKDACAVVGGMLAPDYKIFFQLNKELFQELNMSYFCLNEPL